MFGRLVCGLVLVMTAGARPALLVPALAIVIGHPGRIDRAAGGAGLTMSSWLGASCLDRGK